MSLVRVIFTSLNGLSLEALYNEHSPSSFLSAGFASAHHLRRRDGTYHLPVSILVSSGYFTTEVAFLCSEDVWHDVCFGRDWHSLCLEATACTEIPLSSGHSLCVQHSQATSKCLFITIVTSDTNDVLIPQLFNPLLPRCLIRSRMLAPLLPKALLRQSSLHRNIYIPLHCLHILFTPIPCFYQKQMLLFNL